MTEAPRPDAPGRADQAPDHHQRAMVGGLAWASVTAFFAVNVIVGARWIDPWYAPTRNMISDLGATTCEVMDGMMVCSPWHLAADAVWTVVGLLIMVGAWGFSVIAPPGRPGWWGCLLLAGSGLGMSIIATNPENLRHPVHVAGSLFSGVCGISGMFVLSWALWREHRWRLLAGAGLVATPLSVIGILTGRVLDRRIAGLLERVGLYPFLLWMLACGITVLAVPARARRVRSSRSAS